VLPAALNSRVSDRPAVRAEIAYDPERSQLKIIAVSTPDVVSHLLRLIQLLIDQPPGA